MGCFLPGEQFEHFLFAIACRIADYDVRGPKKGTRVTHRKAIAAFYERAEIAGKSLFSSSNRVVARSTKREWYCTCGNSNLRG